MKQDLRGEVVRRLFSRKGRWDASRVWRGGGKGRRGGAMVGKSRSRDFEASPIPFQLCRLWIIVTYKPA